MGQLEFSAVSILWEAGLRDYSKWVFVFSEDSGKLEEGFGKQALNCSRWCHARAERSLRRTVILFSEGFRRMPVHCLSIASDLEETQNGVLRGPLRGTESC